MGAHRINLDVQTFSKVEVVKHVGELLAPQYISQANFGVSETSSSLGIERQQDPQKH